ncbi:hypothetical protein CkP1_0275 [Citrobacter phage CkP1]|nr:hypothetical protein CkP1_0275 [Citrobacter phage CkP1]
MKANEKVLLVNALKAQIEALKLANGTMVDHWASLTNDAGWSWLDEDCVKNLTRNNNAWAWNGTIKPLLSQYYVKLNDEMIKQLEKQIKDIEDGL